MLTSSFAVFCQTEPRQVSGEKPEVMWVCRKMPWPPETEEAALRMFSHRLSLDVAVRMRTREVPNRERLALGVPAVSISGGRRDLVVAQFEKNTPSF